MTTLFGAQGAAAAEMSQAIPQKGHPIQQYPSDEFESRIASAMATVCEQERGQAAPALTPRSLPDASYHSPAMRLLRCVPSSVATHRLIGSSGRRFAIEESDLYFVQ
jgi:hypothetical protein